MSRRLIAALNPKLVCYVGWDQPLMTYFGQVYDPMIQDDDERIIHWVGTSLGELYEIDELQRAMSRFALIPHSMRITLHGDKDEGR
jgi:hypothetical protein